MISDFDHELDEKWSKREYLRIKVEKWSAEREDGSRCPWGVGSEECRICGILLDCPE